MLMSNFSDSNFEAGIDEAGGNLQDLNSAQ